MWNERSIDMFIKILFKKTKRGSHFRMDFQIEEDFNLYVDKNENLKIEIPVKEQVDVCVWKE